MASLGTIVFLTLVFLTAVLPSRRSAMFSRSFIDWIVDGSSVIIHFVIAPVLQVYAVYRLLDYFTPGLKGALHSSFWLSLGLYVVVDYTWYWNHRLFHEHPFFWKLHHSHHTPQAVDVLSTSRNPLITHFFRVYLWLFGFFAYCLDDPTPFFEIAGIGSALIFWGHTQFCFPAGSKIERTFSLIFVTPRQHLWHHGRGFPKLNYGSVFSLWDRVHGTLLLSDRLPDSYGDPVKLSAWKQIVWPF